ncbi:ComEC/Rec2 family competence protein [Falsiroseomonas sp.]|uniref:ComEC/Rec2 family competence protein n=1 Tax=Falsiroseomonas sp. TaxID=2870721 RepID=UPI00356A94A3
MSLALVRIERPEGDEPGLVARLRVRAMGLAARQQGRFAPWLAVALGAGVLAYFQPAEEPTQGALWLASPLAALAIWVARRARLAGWALGMLAAALLGFGIAGWHAARQPPALDLPSTAVVLTGRVAQVELLPQGRRVTLEGVRLGEGEALPRRLRVRLRPADPSRPAPGDTLRIRALLRPPPPPVVPDGWDFQRAAYFSGLGGSGFALGPAEVIPAPPSLPGFARLRAAVEARVEAMIPGAAGAVAAALLTGSQAAIPPAEMTAMRDSGLAHLLSVSGLHMTIVMGTTFAVLRLAIALVPWLALRVPGKTVAAVGALAAGIGYTLLTGAQVPVQRSLAMAALVTLGLVVGRRALTVRSLAIAAALVLLLAPAEVLGPSFQMSFAAVLALAAGWEVLRGRLPAAGPRAGWRRRLVLAVFGLVVTSVLAGAATAPIGLYHFGRLQLYGVAANAVAVPLTSLLVMPAGMLALVLMPFGLEAPALWAMGQGVEAILASARTVAAWPEASPLRAPPPGPALALAAFGFCWLGLWRGRLRLLGLPVMAAALAGGMAQPPPDLLVAGDSRLIALRTADGVFLHRLPGASAFARDAMLRRLGVAEAAPLPAEGVVARGAIACTPAACRFRPHPGSPEIVLLRTAPPARGARRGEPPDRVELAEACGRAALLVATEPIRPRCRASAAIDRFTVWREGAQAVRLGHAGLQVQSERGSRGRRRWVPPLPIPGRPEALPMAPLDRGA